MMMMKMMKMMKMIQVIQVMRMKTTSSGQVLVMQAQSHAPPTPTRGALHLAAGWADLLAPYFTPQFVAYPS